MAFKDHFSGHAADYSRYRPGYPDALFDYLAGRAPARRVAWDCATGNGQAACRLARHFDRVVATDASARQIQHAAANDRVEYRVEPAEATSLESGSVDLVTVAQALHWFDLARFEAEADRVLVDGGVLAAWSYAILETEPAIDAVIERLYDGILGDYWTPERRMVERGYAELDLSMRELGVRTFAMHAHWTLDELIGYLASWSAAKRYEAERGTDPLLLVRDELDAAWGRPGQSRQIAWPLTVRVWTPG